MGHIWSGPTKVGQPLGLLAHHRTEELGPMALNGSGPPIAGIPAARIGGGGGWRATARWWTYLRASERRGLTIWSSPRWLRSVGGDWCRRDGGLLIGSICLLVGQCATSGELREVESGVDPVIAKLSTIVYLRKTTLVHLRRCRALGRPSRRC
jgi:hypothetical protein